MASICNDPGGRRRILFVDKNGDRKAIWLGKESKRVAEEIKTKVESINTAAIAGCYTAGETAESFSTAAAAFGGDPDFTDLSCSTPIAVAGSSDC